MAGLYTLHEALNCARAQLRPGGAASCSENQKGVWPRQVSWLFATSYTAGCVSPGVDLDVNRSEPDLLQDDQDPASTRQ